MSRNRNARLSRELKRNIKGLAFYAAICPPDRFQGDYKTNDYIEYLDREFARQNVQLQSYTSFLVGFNLKSIEEIEDFKARTDDIEVYQNVARSEKHWLNMMTVNYYPN